MRKHFISLLSAFCIASALMAQENVEVKTGKFSPDWESLNQWECPEWFKDAKFGIWAHWGPQCQAEAGDWYGRFMYFEETDAFQWHLDHFGDPAEFGLKDLCNAWKADQWNPDELVGLYKSVGARYFFTLGNHHDNFDLWDSPYQEWNSVNVGPKKDIVKGWSDACKKFGLPLGVSMHASHAWTWLEKSTDYDGNLTKEDGYTLNGDGSEKWWKGLDPQELYAQQHELSTGWENSGTIHSQWGWQNGASLPSDAYKQKFQNRVLQCINDYRPDILYFDDTVLPFYGCDDQIGLNILSHYYNTSAADNDGKVEVVATGKILEESHKDAMMWDVERGVPDRIQEKYWQTCTCLGDWHYSQSVYNNGSYKSAQQVVDMLVDIVSKNGNMLLSVPVKGNGTIDDKERAILNDIKAWMDVNGNTVYGTRPWKTFGEGPLADAVNPLSAQGFNEGNNYTSNDVRFVQRNDTVFATIMRWPSAGKFTFKSFSITSEYYSGEIKSVDLVGYGPVEFGFGLEGLSVMVPSTHPAEIAPVFAITLKSADRSQYEILQDVINMMNSYIEQMSAEANYINSGKFNTRYLETLQDAVEEAKAITENASEAEIRTAKRNLLNVYLDVAENGYNKGGKFEGDYNADLTQQFLIESEDFSRSTDASYRFGAPEYWTVENFNIPNGGDGVKQGLDKYSGKESLFLGVWNDAANNTDGDLTNARIYRKVKLDAGTYFFGAAFNAVYQLSNAYMFVSDALYSTSELVDKAIAIYQLTDPMNASTLQGLWFRLDEDMEVYLGFQANLLSGSTTQEFRAEKVVLYRMTDANSDALQDLLFEIDSRLEDLIPSVNDNTGFYSKAAWTEMREKCDEWLETLDQISGDEALQAYYDISDQWNAFLVNGKNVGGKPIEAGYTDITIDMLSESDHFARTDETNDADRFGAPKYWTVENFGFGDQAGIDNITGVDCLHLEVWWNSNAFPENGYDVANVRLYQKVTLPEGRYYFGASYPTMESNEDMYIFASDELLNTSDIPTQSIAYEKVVLAPTDGSFRGIFFTLDEEKEVYLGVQTDFSKCVTNNVRWSAVKLLYYGQMSYDKLSEQISSIESALSTLKIDDNTGHYSPKAYDVLLEAIAAAKEVSPSADMETLNAAYNALNDAYTVFLTEGKNPGGQPKTLEAIDITDEYLVEHYNFTRTSDSGTARFGRPEYWTVENFSIPNGGDGTKQGIDSYPGYNCLMLGIWEDKDKNESGSLTDARIYKTINLPAGSYYFGATYDAIYQLGEAYIFAASEPLATSDIQSQSIAYYPVMNGALDGKYYGIYFTLTEPQTITLGWQANLQNGSPAQEFRAAYLKLLRYDNGDDPVAITEKVLEKIDATQPVEIYNIQGMRLNSIPSKGLYILRQGNRVVKVMK